MSKLIAAAASAALLASAGLATSCQADPCSSATPICSLPRSAIYAWGGRHYCWYYNGWRGPGWYWCGYPWRTRLRLGRRLGLERLGRPGAGWWGWGTGHGYHDWRGGGLPRRRLYLAATTAVVLAAAAYAAVTAAAARTSRAAAPMLVAAASTAAAAAARRGGGGHGGGATAAAAVTLVGGQRRRWRRRRPPLASSSAAGAARLGRARPRRAFIGVRPCPKGRHAPRRLRFRAAGRPHRAAARLAARRCAAAGGGSRAARSTIASSATCRTCCAPGDALVFNDTRVIPARLQGVRCAATSSRRSRGDAAQARLAIALERLRAGPAKRLAVGDRIALRRGERPRLPARRARRRP